MYRMIPQRQKKVTFNVPHQIGKSRTDREYLYNRTESLFVEDSRRDIVLRNCFRYTLTELFTR